MALIKTFTSERFAALSAIVTGAGENLLLFFQAVRWTTLNFNGMDYFAPLSSFKDKHARMQESVDFIKVKRYAVININNRFPVPDELATYVDISKEKNERYRSLLLAEYRAIKSMQEKIRKNADIVYKHRIEAGTSTSLGKRCNDFKLLEEASRNYKKK